MFTLITVLAAIIVGGIGGWLAGRLSTTKWSSCLMSILAVGILIFAEYGVFFVLYRLFDPAAVEEILLAFFPISLTVLLLVQRFSQPYITPIEDQWP